jgi:predicted aspartyl protease
MLVIHGACATAMPNNRNNNRSNTGQTTNRATNLATRDTHFSERDHNINSHLPSFLTDAQIKQENIEETNDSYLAFEVPRSYSEPGEATDPLDSLEPEIFDTPFQECFEILNEQETDAENVNNNNNNNKEDLIPQVLALALTIGGKEGKHNLIALLDTGASGAMINQRAIPEGVRMKEAPNGKFVTTAGTFESTQLVKLTKVSFPEFSISRRFGVIDCHVFNSPDCPYDLILGRELLSQAKIKFDFETNETIWLDVSVPFHPRNYFKGRRIDGITDIMHTARTQTLDSLVHQASVKDANYDVQDPTEVAEAQQHLNDKQREDLKKMFNQHRKLFSGRIGRYPHRKYHIDLVQGAEPYHCPRPYRIPQVDLPAYRKEMERQVDLGLLEKVYDTEWGFPGFIRPKKDGTIRTIEDFRELNKRIKRTRFIIPEIRDILERGRKYKYLTKIDISMCYYTHVGTR